MRQPLGPIDFFAIEAGDCLDRLERVLSRPEGVAGDDFVRDARLLRGAALMANVESVAQAAGALEALARAVRDGAHPWDTATRELALGVLADFRALVHRVHDWSDGDAARARRIAGDLTLATGGRSGRVRTPVPSADPRAGVRAYVAREAALIAEALDQAASRGASLAGGGEPLREVQLRMQPLRGLADLSEFSPLPELLDAVDLAASAVRQSAIAPGHAREVLDAAARALGRLARGPDAAPDGGVGAEVDFVAELLLARLADEQDVVPVASLFLAGDAAPVVTIGGVAAGGHAGLGTVELVSHSDYLTQMADRLEAASAGAPRHLAFASLLGTCRALGIAATGRSGVQAFAAEAVQRIATGEGNRDREAFVAWLRKAARLLRDAGESPEADTSAAWAALVQPAAGAAPAAVRETADDTRDVVPIESLLLAEPVVPIGSLAPEPGNGVLASTVFERSLRAYQRRLRVAPIAAPAPATTAAPVTGADAVPEVPVASLCYRGRAAWRRAADVRREVQDGLGAGRDWTALRPLLEELLDLVPLALDDA